MSRTHIAVPQDEFRPRVSADPLAYVLLAYRARSPFAPTVNGQNGAPGRVRLAPVTDLHGAKPTACGTGGTPKIRRPLIRRCVAPLPGIAPYPLSPMAPCP